MDIMEYFKTMKEVLLHPTATLKKNKKIELTDGLTYTVLAGVVVGIINTVLTMGLGFAGIIMTPIMAVIGALIVGTIFYVIAMVFGCKKGIGNFIGAYALVMASLMLITWIPIVGAILSLYGLYLIYAMLTQAMDMTSTGAILTILIPIIIMVILAVLLATLIIGLLTAAGMGALAGGLTGSLV